MMVELNANWLLKGSAHHQQARSLVQGASNVGGAVGPTGVASMNPAEAAPNQALLQQIAARPQLDQKILNGLKGAFAANKSAKLVWVDSLAWDAVVTDDGDTVTITVHCPSSHTLVP
jgi:hypothetical protein